jgi:hypothetical protein
MEKVGPHERVTVEERPTAAGGGLGRFVGARFASVTHPVRPKTRSGPRPAARRAPSTQERGPAPVTVIPHRADDEGKAEGQGEDVVGEGRGGGALAVRGLDGLERLA